MLMNMKAPSPPTNEQAGLARPNANPKSKPKRPLSGYNLFYRFKRQKIVEALAAAGGAAIDKDAIHGIIAAPPGLEGVPESATNLPPDAVRALRRERILKDLEGNTDPRDSRTRIHCKNRNALNGAMSFVELGKVMNAGWKGCDPFAKSVFDELSRAGRERYRQRMTEYNALAEEDPAEAKATPAPASANKNKPVRRKLPVKKYIAAKVKSSLSPSLNDGASNGPARGGPHPIKFKWRPADEWQRNGELIRRERKLRSGTEPSLPFIVRGGHRQRGRGHAQRSRADRVQPVAPQDIPAPPCASPSNVIEELLRLRVERLEVQLAGERLRARVRELQEVERSRRLLAREELARTAFDNSVAQSPAAAAATPVPSNYSFLLRNGLPCHSGHCPSSVLQWTMSERTAVLSQIADWQNLQTLPGVPFKRPSPRMPGSAFPDGIDFDGRPVKKQRMDSLFAARSG